MITSTNLGRSVYDFFDDFFSSANYTSKQYGHGEIISSTANNVNNGDYFINLAGKGVYTPKYLSEGQSFYLTNGSDPNRGSVEVEVSDYHTGSLLRIKAPERLASFDYRTYFMRAPYFFSGTWKKLGEYLLNKKDKDVNSIDIQYRYTPIVFLQEVYSQTIYPFRHAMEQSCDVKLFILEAVPFSNSTYTPDLMEYSVDRMRNLTDIILRGLDEHPETFMDDTEITIKTRKNIGAYSNNTGNSRGLIPKAYSGIEASFNLTFRKC